MECGTRVCSRWLWSLALIIVLAGAGCGGEETAGNQIPEPSGETLKDAAGNRVALDPAALQIDKLINHQNPVVANNAKQLKQAFEANDYSRAAFAITSIASIRLTFEYESIVRDALLKFREVATIAAEKGDANAKFALAHLKDTFGE